MSKSKSSGSSVKSRSTRPSSHSPAKKSFSGAGGKPKAPARPKSSAGAGSRVGSSLNRGVSRPISRRRRRTSLLGWLLGAVALMAIVLVIVLLVRDREPQNPPDPEPTSVPVSQSSGVEMPSDPAARNGMFTEPPAMQIDPTKQYTAIFDTERGEITVQLYADKAPLTVNNFVFLTRSGFYDNTTFHRVIAGFMAQGGDPTGVGSGGPGYNFADEFDPTLRHDSAGILSMANTGSAGTNGSQFFLTFDATPWLDDVHTIFGKVTEGLDVLLSIQPRDPSTATEPGDLIRTIRIVEN